MCVWARTKEGQKTEIGGVPDRGASTKEVVSPSIRAFFLVLEILTPSSYVLFYRSSTKDKPTTWGYIPGHGMVFLHFVTKRKTI